MIERIGIISMEGKPLTLLGKEPVEENYAPDFEVTDIDFNPVYLSSYEGKICIISSILSLDTSVCDKQTRKFYQEAANLDPDTIILNISMDLPFAQKRWKDKTGLNDAVTLSDYRLADFGNEYGILIKELHLLARAVFIVDRKGKLQYSQIVREITNEPDYGSALAALKELK